MPDGTAVVEDDLELTASSLRRYGTRLYVLGDAVIPAESADLLAQIEFLHVTGEVELHDALEAAFFAIPELECGKVVHEDALPKQTRAKAKDEARSGYRDPQRHPADPVITPFLPARSFRQKLSAGRSQDFVDFYCARSSDMIY